MVAGVPTNHEKIDVLLDYSTCDVATQSFTLPQWATFVSVLIPNFTNNANVGIEMSDDGETTWYPVIDPADGADLVICASGSDPGYVDISDFIRAFIPRGSIGPPETAFRFSLSVAEDTSDFTFYVYVRG